MVHINGEEKTGYENSSVWEMLQRENYDRERIAVEINGDIVSKSEYREVVLRAGDVIEVVSFVGGG